LINSSIKIHLLKEADRAIFVEVKVKRCWSYKTL